MNIFARIILELLDVEKHNFRIIGYLWDLNVKWMQAAMRDKVVYGKVRIKLLLKL